MAPQNRPVKCLLLCEETARFGVASVPFVGSLLPGYVYIEGHCESHRCMETGGQVCLPIDKTGIYPDDTAFASVGFLWEDHTGAFSGPDELSRDGP